MLIAEDEPPTLRDLADMVGKVQGVRVVATAANGAEALDLLQVHTVDLVLTDVVMPVVDGLELVRQALKAPKCPDFVLVSGYDEFEYAREALRLGVSEYLLKPYSDSDVSKTIADAKGRAERRRVTALGTYLLSEKTQDYQEAYTDVQASFGDVEWVQAAIVNLGWFAAGGPSAENTDVPDAWPAEVKRHIANRVMSANAVVAISPDRPQTAVFVVCMRDRRDVISSVLSDSLYRILGRPPSTFFTGVVTPPVDNWASLRHSVRECLDSVSSKTVPYRCIVYPGPDASEAGLSRSSVPERAAPAYLAQLGSAGDRTGAERLLVGAFSSWIERGTPQRNIEHSILQSLRTMVDAMVFAKDPDLTQIETTLVRRLRSTKTMEEGTRVIADSLARLFDLRANRLETAQLVQRLREYLEAHYAEDIDNQTLAQVFDRVPHYLSALYKKHTGVSPTEHLAQIRIEAACDLMDTNPSLPLKDVAVSVGFSDQAYFSRVFRKLRGYPPSEFRSRRSKIL